MQKAYLGVGVSQGACAAMIVVMLELCCIDGDVGGGGGGVGDVILPRTKKSVACSTNTGHTLKGHRHRVPMLGKPATATEPGIEPVGAAFHHASKH